MDISSSESPDRSKHIKIGPREVEIIALRDAKTRVHFKMVTGEVLEGAIAWYDEASFHVIAADGLETTIMMSAVAWYGRRR